MKNVILSAKDVQKTFANNGEMVPVLESLRFFMLCPVWIKQQQER